jgi:chaperonin GroES
MEQVHPIRDMVLVKYEEPPKQTASGLLHLPPPEKTVKTAKVLAVGPGRMTEHGILVAPSVAVGERVIVQEYNMQQRATRVGDGEENVFLVPEMDIPAVIGERVIAS